MQVESVSREFADIVAEALEQTAMVFADRANDAPAFEGPVVEAELILRGPRALTLRLTTTLELAALFAANLLGIEEGQQEALSRSEDAFGEILNVLSGMVLEQLFAGEGVYQFGIPVVRRLPEPSAPVTSVAVMQADFVIDGAHRLQASLASRDVA